jgi:hypothetical protein
LITPGLVVVLVAGIYLASKLHMWSTFYVQWGIGVTIVLGGMGGVFFAPRERKLAELAERDLAAAGDGPFAWSAEYKALDKAVAIGGTLANVLILVTVYLMTVQAN